MKKKPKTPSYLLKSGKDHMDRYGYIMWSRRIKPEWKQAFEELIAKFRKELINANKGQSDEM